MPNQITVPFHGSKLLIVDRNGEPFTPMRPIVEGMGMSWGAQFTKLKTNSQRWGVAIIETPTNSNTQDSLCLPLRKLFGWLQTISPNKVKASIRDRVIQYQNECDDALWDYWNQKCNKPTAPVMPPQTMRLLMVMDQGRVVSTQVVSDDCMVIGLSQIPNLLNEPGYFSIQDLKRIADTAMALITDAAQVNCPSIGHHS